ncbi:MAG: 50S ribosomal protein L24 [Methylococcales bacterium]|jgi:large subunit ribosomal protein L24|nr:50S ribosomal protein L24 [Methylococcales bacterium]HIG90826.1 50S ribosomal protein L24 [Methylococcaceae bacterium]MBT3507661.1 50S ribosomal protein L24 [Methylococcales bacterium]MBT3698470.1 50S ribosomal protein L24 [Methylococcales bacterium]MBT3815652.1 50S ribosomal protein L24 [Methylococcales bacterium]
MNKIRKGDDVLVLAGKDKGKQGVVSHLVGDDRVVVLGVNQVKKHQKPNPQKNIEGGIVEKAMPIHLSNVALYNQATKKADKVGFKTLDDGTKVRFFKSNNEIVDA